MKKIAKYLVAATSVALLVACGGGGGEGVGTGSAEVAGRTAPPPTSASSEPPVAPATPATPATPAAPASPLAKYIGTYSGCDQTHTKSTYELEDAGGGELDLHVTHLTYEKADCTGTVLGTYAWSAPATVAYVATVVATVADSGLPANVAIDNLRVSVAKVGPTLTGPAVTGHCVTVSRFQTCHMDLEPSQAGLNEIYQVGLHLSGDTVHLLEPENGIFTFVGAFSKI